MGIGFYPRVTESEKRATEIATQMCRLEPYTFQGFTRAVKGNPRLTLTLPRCRFSHEGIGST